MQATLLKLDVKLHGLGTGEEGQDVLEFALLASLIALVCLTGVGNVASSIHTVFSNISSSLAAVGSRPAAPEGSLSGGDLAYSAKSAAPRQERVAPLDAETAQRQQFVEELQQKLERDSEESYTIKVEQDGDELVLTGPPARDLPPESLHSKARTELGDVSNDRLCGMGFKGARVRSGPGNEGAYQSFNCSSANQ